MQIYNQKQILLQGLPASQKSVAINAFRHMHMHVATADERLHIDSKYVDNLRKTLVENRIHSNNLVEIITKMFTATTSHEQHDNTITLDHDNNKVTLDTNSIKTVITANTYYKMMQLCIDKPNFETHLHSCIIEYIAFGITTTDYVLPQQLFDGYIDAVRDTTIIECFASPFDTRCGLRAKYCSIAKSDKNFGSLGNFFNVDFTQFPKVLAIVNPPDITDIITETIKRILAIDHPDFTAVVCIEKKYRNTIIASRLLKSIIQISPTHECFVISTNPQPLHESLLSHKPHQ